MTIPVLVVIFLVLALVLTIMHFTKLFQFDCLGAAVSLIAIALLLPYLK